MQLRALETEVGDLKEALRSRKLVEQAKGILMEKEGLTEAEAFKRIQQQSRNQNISMAKLAEAIITAGNLLSGKRAERKPSSLSVFTHFFSPFHQAILLKNKWLPQGILIAVIRNNINSSS